ncbi:hypothetical protein OG21DRAFT_1492279 [Imleria badia]|nr:hypothetical protein OG21DRAFT_1492279 [Imleria badia]
MAQQAGGEAMQEIAAVVKDLTRYMAPPPPPIDNLMTFLQLTSLRIKTRQSYSGNLMKHQEKLG